MNSEIIIYNECTNSGDRVYAYHDDVVGAMEAYGYSAFLAAKLVKGVLCLWNNEMQLPCAVLRKEQMDALLKMGETDAQESSAEMVLLNLSAPEAYDKLGYDSWLGVLKARKTKVAQPLPVDEVISTLSDSAASDANRKPIMGSVKRNMMAVAIGVFAIIGVIILAIFLWG